MQVIKSESRVCLTTVTFEFLEGDDDDDDDDDGEFVQVMRESPLLFPHHQACLPVV